MDYIKFSMQMVQKFHLGQMYGTSPFTKHLEMVHEELLNHFPDSTKEMEVAAIFHDVLEDCDISLNGLQAYVNLNLSQFDIDCDEVTNLVHLLTDQEGDNRKERQQKTYEAIVKNDKAIKIKLCDRFVNMRETWRTQNIKLAKMYAKEHNFFQQFFWNGDEETFKIREKIDGLNEQLFSLINHK